MVTYCQDTDVRRLLQANFSFTKDSSPSTEDINETIEEAEDQVNQITNHSWKSETVTNEYYDLSTNRNYTYDTEIQINLNHRDIKTLDSDSGDKIEVWDGSTYNNWITTQTRGRASDWWIDKAQGILYLRYYSYFTKKAVRMSYRYGSSAVPKDIKKATSILSAIEFLENDDRSSMLAESGDVTKMSYLDRVSKLQTRADRILRNRTEIFVI